MASVRELSALLQGSMQNPAQPGPGICPKCRGFPNEGWEEDRGCGQFPDHLDAIVPISYAPGLGQLHTALRGYKDDHFEAVRRRFHVRLASVLWQFLAEHERCVAAASSAPEFDLVTVVPSKTPERDEERGALRTLVGETCRHTADRYERVLRPTGKGLVAHEFAPERFEATSALGDRNGLLIDDMWTSGANAQSAACAMKAAGAATVGLVVIGRFVRRDWADHGDRLDELPRGFDWDTCAVHAR